jgi:phosphoenolpyruvate carboxykinase (GTP)
MLPFCGYNMADYWSHWLDIGEKLGRKAPAIFQVNWFRKGDDGEFIWPGFGENARVLEWIVRRVEHKVASIDTPIGRIPRPSDLDTRGLGLSRGALDALFEIDEESWLDECDLTEEYFATFGDRTPQALRDTLRSIRYGLRSTANQEQVA